MTRPIAIGLAALVAAGALEPRAAEAGVYADDLAKCLVASTNEADKNALVRWMFVAMASHPEVRSLASVSDDAREQMSRETAALFMRLMTQTCAEPARNAIQYEGPATIEASFSVLGSVAARGLMAHPNVSLFVQQLDHHLDGDALREALAVGEGGASPPPAASVP